MENWVKNATTSERLQEIMRIRDMKQADLARATGISRGAISNYVLGRYEPKSDVINKLAKALNCSEMWLWGYDVPKERETFDDKRDIPFSLRLFGKTPDEPKLTEGEETLLNLFRKIPEDKQSVVLEMIRLALKTQE